MRKTAWDQLFESTEGPNVTVQIPRHIAEDLLRALSTALEIDDTGEEPGDMGLHIEPDEDDLGGPPDGDEDDIGAMLGMGGEEGDDDALVPAGDDSDEEDDDEGGSDEEEDDDEEEQDESEAYPGMPESVRLESYLGFKKLKGKLAHQKGVKDPGALAASIGRKKYGAKGMAAKAKKG